MASALACDGENSNKHGISAVRVIMAAMARSKSAQRRNNGVSAAHQTISAATQLAAENKHGVAAQISARSKTAA